MNATFNDRGQIVADKKMISSAGAFKATLGDLTGVIRGRVLPAPPLSEDFEDFKLNEDSLVDQGVKFAYPPLPWIGARFKFEVREKGGSKVLRKTIDNKRLQRATVFIGEQSMSNYTVQADVLTDGRRRKMSDVGIINQRYYIVLKGNEQKIEINSNLDRIRVPERGSPPNYRWKANTWHTLKSRIDVSDDAGQLLGVTFTLSMYTGICGENPNNPGEPLLCALLCLNSRVHPSGSASSLGQALARTIPEPSAATSMRALIVCHVLAFHR